MRFLQFCSLILFAFITSTAHAYVYEDSFSSIGRDYASRLSRAPTLEISQLSGAPKDLCAQRYAPILNDGVIDIRIFLGYFDWTIGYAVNYQNKNYGLSPSIDLGAFSSLKRLLTSRCSGNLQFCGFSQDSKNPYRFTKSVNLQGRTYQAKIDMVFASVSEYLNANTGKYASEQRQRSDTAKSAFVSALKSADAVFYFGHSRNGGGPDFEPPVFVPGTNKVNYKGFYKVKRPGFNTMINALEAGRAPSILGLMSCDSRDHFLPRLRSTAPRMGIISSKDVLKVDGVFTAMIGGVDSILRGQCQKGFYQALRLTSFNQQYITMDGMFE